MEVLVKKKVWEIASTSGMAVESSGGADGDAAGVVLFVSFDLVNSTAFKSHSRDWPRAISSFYDHAVNVIQEMSENFFIWKYVGDEVLLFKEVKNIDALASDVHHIFESVNKIVKELDRLFPESKNFLSVKATAWLACVWKVKNGVGSNKFPDSLSNVVVNFDVWLSGTTSIDFLGPDVDIGFRISKFSHNKQLVISANLVRLLARYSSRTSITLSNFKIVAYKELKGVWDGRPYPIIWYHEDWEKIDRDFYYDDLLSGDIVETIRTEKYREVDWLEKIYSDLNKENDIEDLKNAIKNETSVINVPSNDTIEQNKLSEVHCVAVCFDDSCRIMIAQRPSTKRRLPGCWEFGCGQMSLNQHFHECLRISYKADFGIELADISKIPISIYTIKESRVIPGLIFAARIRGGGSDDLPALAKEKHAEVKWVTRERAEGISPDDCVPDFMGTIEKAYRYAKDKNWLGGTVLPATSAPPILENEEPAQGK